METWSTSFRPHKKYFWCVHTVIKLLVLDLILVRRVKIDLVSVLPGVQACKLETIIVLSPHPYLIKPTSKGNDIVKGGGSWNPRNNCFVNLEVKSINIPKNKWRILRSLGRNGAERGEVTKGYALQSRNWYLNSIFWQLKKLFWSSSKDRGVGKCCAHLHPWPHQNCN